MRNGMLRMMPEMRHSDKRQIPTFATTVSSVMLMHMKRTTLQLDETLFAELRRRAAAEGRTLTEVVERTLRAGLGALREHRRVRIVLPSYDLGPFLADPARPGRLPRPAEDE